MNEKNLKSEVPSNIKVPRYRTIKECLAEIKKIDSNTAITENFIRRLCKQGKIIYRLSGNKSLVSLDSLLEYLESSSAE